MACSLRPPSFSAESRSEDPIRSSGAGPGASRGRNLGPPGMAALGISTDVAAPDQGCWTLQRPKGKRMATVSFSGSEEVEAALNEAFEGRNKSVVTAKWMHEAAERVRRKQRSREAIERILRRCRQGSRPSATISERYGRKGVHARRRGPEVAPNVPPSHRSSGPSPSSGTSAPDGRGWSSRRTSSPKSRPFSHERSRVERRLMRGGILAMERFEKSFLLAIGEKMAGTIDDIAKEKGADGRGESARPAGARQRTRRNS